MRYLLDATVVIPYLANDSAVTDLLMQLAQDGFALSILVYLAAYEGAVDYPDRAAAQCTFDAFVDDVPILPVSLAVAHRCAGLRAVLKRQGKNLRRCAFDLVIAATALEHGLELVTHNLRDDQDIPGLALRAMRP